MSPPARARPQDFENPRGLCRYMGYTWALKWVYGDPFWALSIYHIPTWTLWGRNARLRREEF